LSESPGAPGRYAAINYDTWDQNNNIDEYSDLSYEQYSFTLGGTYNFTPAFYTTVEATYDMFESDEEYVYGDEDGDMFTGYIAIGCKF
jgi:predicted porin